MVTETQGPLLVLWQRVAGQHCHKFPSSWTGEFIWSTAIWELDLKKKKKSICPMEQNQEDHKCPTDIFSQLNYMHSFFTMGVRIKKLTGTRGTAHANSTHGKGPLKCHSCLKHWWVCELSSILPLEAIRWPIDSRALHSHTGIYTIPKFSKITK